MRIFVGFVIGTAIGGLVWFLQSQSVPWADSIISTAKPFGDVLVAILKMIVIPVIFFSLVTGSASLPVNKFGKIGIKVITWYFACSLLAALIGTIVALGVNPGDDASSQTAWTSMSTKVSETANQVAERAEQQTESGLGNLLMQMFQNPFSALAESNFLAVILFSILFGLALRVLIDNSDAKDSANFQSLLRLIEAGRDAVFKLVDWIMEYTPIGVFALSIVNFGTYGPDIVGPYVSVTLGVIAAVLMMTFVVYPTLLFVATKRNPYPLIRTMQEAIITAFGTRSSAATLPVTLRVAEHDLKIRNELASFSLPLGATINMDGVCVHLPMFAILSANLFGIDISALDLLVMIITTVIASVGVGGVPGGSLMLMFMILHALGLDPEQTAIIVALALGINPILDMFETANNVTGDLVCTYAVAATSNLLEEDSNESNNNQSCAKRTE
jgi:proton glutamate symport protein